MRCPSAIGQGSGACVADLVVAQPQLFQPRVVLQGVGEGSCASVADLVPATVQVFQQRIDLQGLAQRGSSRVADVVADLFRACFQQNEKKWMISKNW